MRFILITLSFLLLTHCPPQDSVDGQHEYQPYKGYNYQCGEALLTIVLSKKIYKDGSSNEDEYEVCTIKDTTDDRILIEFQDRPFDSLAGIQESECYKYMIEELSPNCLPLFEGRSSSPR